VREAILAGLDPAQRPGGEDAPLVPMAGEA
jgi:hypothetical protein